MRASKLQDGDENIVLLTIGYKCHARYARNGTERKGQACTVSFEEHDTGVLLKAIFKRKIVISSPLDRITLEWSL